MFQKFITALLLFSSSLFAQTGPIGEELETCQGGGGTGCTGNVIYVDASSSSNGPGLTWDTAYRKLQTALSAAMDGDCIWVVGGEYFPSYSTTPNRDKSFVINKSLNLYGGFAGYETCLADRNSLPTTLSGDIAGTPGILSDDSYTIVEIYGNWQMPGGAIDVLIDGFRIRNASNLVPTTTVGAGIDCRDAVTLTLKNTTVRETEGIEGPGLYFVRANVDVDRCRFKNNTSMGDGGAISAASFANVGYPGKLRAFNTNFRNNHALGGGGAIFLSPGSGPSEFQNCVFFENSAERGGAAFLDITPPTTINGNPPVTLPPVLSEATFVNCTITNNSAAQNGPAIYADSNCIGIFFGSAFLTVNNSIVWNNAGPNSNNACTASNPSGQISGYENVYVDNSIVPVGSVWAYGSNVALDPNFVSSTNFHFQSGPLPSPAIDIGSSSWLLNDIFDLDDDGNTSEATPLDKDLRARIQGLDVDAGAYED